MSIVKYMFASCFVGGFWEVLLAMDWFTKSYLLSTCWQPWREDGLRDAIYSLEVKAYQLACIFSLTHLGIGLRAVPWTSTASANTSNFNRGWMNVWWILRYSLHSHEGCLHASIEYLVSREEKKTANFQYHHANSPLFLETSWISLVHTIFQTYGFPASF